MPFVRLSASCVVEQHDCCYCDYNAQRCNFHVRLLPLQPSNILGFSDSSLRFLFYLVSADEEMPTPFLIRPEPGNLGVWYPLPQWEMVSMNYLWQFHGDSLRCRAVRSTRHTHHSPTTEPEEHLVTTARTLHRREHHCENGESPLLRN